MFFIIKLGACWIYPSGLASIFREGNLLSAIPELMLKEKLSYFLIYFRRMILGEEVDNATIEGSTIRIYPDLTSMSSLIYSDFFIIQKKLQ
jgi:hypothetical protein